MSEWIQDRSDLEAKVGKTPPPMELKVIDHLDPGALRWIAACPLMFVSFAGELGPDLTIAGGAAGFVDATQHEMRIPFDALDQPEAATMDAAVGSIFLLPGLGEVLRVNGRVVEISDRDVRIAVQECYGHCPRALLRSGLWDAAPLAAAPQDDRDFVAAAQFMVLATVDENGRADVSPRGDPAGKLARLSDEGLWFADRPGNRRLDSFKNILTQPKVMAILIVPGSTEVRRVKGHARITTQENIRQSFAVQDKVPNLAVQVGDLAIEAVESSVLRRADIWPVGEAKVAIDPNEIVAGHVKLNKGLTAKLMVAAFAIPGVTKAVQDHLKKSLY